MDIRSITWRIEKCAIFVRRALRKVRREVLHDLDTGLRFHIDGDSDRYVFGEIFGKEDAYRLMDLVPLMKGGDVIDIGGHKGFFSIFAATKANRVFAFEPDQRNFEFLCRNIAANNLSNATAMNKAVSDAVGIKQFTISDQTAARHTFFESSFSGSRKTVDVECTTLTQIFDDFQIEEVSLLKMDCEGSEYDIIYNADPAIFDKINNITMEIHEADNIGHSKDTLLQHMQELGYTVEIYDERWLDSLHVWMCLFRKNAS